MSGGSTYYFRVIAETADGENRSKPVYGETICQKAPDAPKNLVVQPSGDKQLTISWNASAGATKYDVYRYSGNTKTYVLKGTTTELSYVDSDSFSIGTAYHYKVVAVNEGETYRLESAKSLSANAVVLGTPAAPAGLTAVSNAPHTVTVKWSAVKTATKYNVYRYHGIEKTYIYLGSTTGTS